MLKIKNKNKSKKIARCSLQASEHLEVGRGLESELSGATGLLEQHALGHRTKAERIVRTK